MVSENVFAAPGELFYDKAQGQAMTPAAPRAQFVAGWTVITRRRLQVQARPGPERCRRAVSVFPGST
jgi:hypothetical protein